MLERWLIYIYFNKLLLVDYNHIFYDSRIAYQLCSSLANLFLYSYKADFIQGFRKKNDQKLARSFTFPLCYIDFLSLVRWICWMHPIELKIKDTTDTARSVSYLDIHLEIDSEVWLRTKVHGKRDDFNLPTVNFPFICSNIPAAPANDPISQTLWFLSWIPW